MNDDKSEFNNGEKRPVFLLFNNNYCIFLLLFKFKVGKEIRFANKNPKEMVKFNRFSEERRS